MKELECMLSFALLFLHKFLQFLPLSAARSVKTHVALFCASGSKIERNELTSREQVKGNSQPVAR